MDYKPIILGSESSLLDFHMNSQYSNVKKLLISNEIILNSFENQDIAAFITSQKEANPNQYVSSVKAAEAAGLFEVNFQDEFYKYLQEYITKLSDELNVELKDYSFMSSISNTRYHVILRSSTFSVYEYYIEKGALLSAIKQVLQKYLNSSLSTISLRELDNFQIEIFEAEEYQKTLFLKKERDSLILYSTFGFFNNQGENMNFGGEMYYSKGDEFNFFENSQEDAIVRQHNKIERKEIYHKEKILNADELKQINQVTKHINNVLLEIGINSKGVIKILHARTNEFPLEVGSKNGIIYSASSKEFDKIALITSKSQYSEDAANPQYLLLRTKQDVDEFLRSITLASFDGIIINQNLYHPFFEQLGVFYDCDIVFYKGNLHQALEVTFLRNSVEIQGFEEKKANSGSPFSSIIENETPKKDELLDRFKNVDLSTPPTSAQSVDTQSVQSIAESLISSPNSSTAKKSTGSLMSFGASTDSSGRKKSAFELLSESAFTQEKKIEEQTPTQSETPKQEIEEKSSNINDTWVNVSSETQIHGHDSVEEVAKELVEEETAQPQEDTFFNTPEPKVNEVIPETTEPTSSTFDFNSVLGSDSTHQSESIIEENTDEITLNEYDSILATRFLTPTSIESQGHIVDSSVIHELSDPRSSYIVVASEEDIQNKDLNYILPRSSGYHQDAHTLINTPEDFFLFAEDDEFRGVVVNLSTLRDEIKENILNDSINKFGVISLITTSDDLPLLENCIEYIDFVFVKDISSQEEFEGQKELLLMFEKRALMKKLR